MYKVFAAAACTISVLAGASAAVAGTTGNGWQQRAAAAQSTGHTVMVGLGPEGHRLIVTIAGTSFAYNPANGNVNQLPTPAENISPTTGIGIVVKKNPGSSAAPVSGPDSHGAWTIDPSTMTAGNYNIVVTVQAHAINTKGTGVAGRTTSSSTSMTSASAAKALPAQTMLLTFHVVVDSKGMTMDPKMQPTATVAPGSGTASQQ